MTKHKHAFTLCIIFILPAAIALSQDETASPDTTVSTAVAVVNGKEIAKSEFEERFNQYVTPSVREQIEKERKGDVEAIIKSYKLAFVESLINEQLLLKEALNKGMDKDEKIIKQLDQYRVKVLADRMIERELERTEAVTDDEVKNYYLEHRDEFRTPERVKLRHILFRMPPEMSDEEQKEVELRAASVVQQLHEGADFAAMAEKYSDASDAARGGLIGPVNRGQLYIEIETAAFSIPVGGISDVIRSPIGLHIIKVLEKKGGVVQEFEAVKDTIHNGLAARRTKEVIEKLVKTLRSKATVTIHKDTLLE